MRSEVGPDPSESEFWVIVLMAIPYSFPPVTTPAVKPWDHLCWITQATVHPPRPPSPKLYCWASLFTFENARGRVTSWHFSSELTSYIKDRKEKFRELLRMRSLVAKLYCEPDMRWAFLQLRESSLMGSFAWSHAWETLKPWKIY